ncbi:hypothetical protein NDU88_008879 [Pleurodeles waltl]|uniref:Uncharacterized protein n=1 Tax=Pleurodeles waltl TaxID=8319 RepID=A0AAV7PXG5_PLEWA|nr:hypothetical protein NDU88_008879 [Pleurodeles waltl]
MGAQTNLRPGALRPLYTPGNPYQGLRDPVPGYLPPSRAEDKSQARGSHPWSYHSPGAQGPARAPEPKQAGVACALAQCTPRPSRVQQAGGREHPPQALQGTLQPGFSKPQLGLGHGVPNQPPTRGPEASLHARKPLLGPAGPLPRLCASQQGQKTKPRQRVPTLGPAAGRAPEHKPAEDACALAQCTTRPCRVRQAGG